ncbi:MAG: glycosyltransferase family 39 protein [Chloroflexi bacterium]|nr:glycosyltransferase family 39 protein [Chloroflexota bacterium]
MDEAWNNPPLEDDETAGLSPTSEADEAGRDEPAVRPDEEPPAVRVEDLTLAEFLGHIWRTPGETWATLKQVLQTPPDTPPLLTGDTALRPTDAPVRRAPRPAVIPAPLHTARAVLTERLAPLSADQQQARQREGVQFGLRLAALLVGLYGSGILALERTEQLGLNVGGPYLLLAFGLWLVSEIYGSWPAITRWRQGQPLSPVSEVPQDEANWTTAARHWLLERGVLAGAGLAFSLMAAAFNAGNRFTAHGVVAWFISVVLWVAAVAPRNWNWRRGWAAVRAVRLRRSATFYALVMILVVGAFFRLNQLSQTPPEMTSDHVEKLLDAQRVLDGNPQVFFPNNGGREPFQMYAMALLSQVPGLGMNFTTLKLLSALEGILTLPVLWWMGREVIGRDNPRLANLVGLALAALVAVSYWHVALSRLGLRIVLTVLVTALLIIFLTRALRHNRRGDYILAGLTLGFGLYTYQAVRMLPVVVLIGIGLAIVFKARNFLERRAYALNFAMLVLVALVAFVPLLTFSIQYPDYFWMRTSGRLLGDDVITTRDEAGRLIERQATLQERVAAFQKNLPVLMDNIRNALLMYNWKGDVLWFNAVPNRPALDPLTGTLLVIGLAAWLARLFRRRDVADWLLPIMLFIMLLPSAFSIAYPIENPSATRTSGTLPEAYLFAALPLALLASSLARVLRGKRGLLAGGTLAGVALLLAGSANYRTYFTDYHEAYLISSPAPYSEAGAFLKGFAESGGSFGNAFMLAYPYWWDHRAVGIEAGLMDWPNGIVDPDGDSGPQSAADDVPRFLYLASQATNGYRFNPEKDILFFYSPADERSDRRLSELFPNGYAQLVHSRKPNDDFRIYRVPALGTEGFIDFVVRTGAAG